MANGNGSGWKEWVIGVLLMLCSGLFGFIWSNSHENSIQLNMDARTMAADIASIKATMIAIDRRLEKLEEKK